MAEELAKLPSSRVVRIDLTGNPIGQLGADAVRRMMAACSPNKHVLFDEPSEDSVRQPGLRTARNPANGKTPLDPTRDTRLMMDTKTLGKRPDPG